MEEMTEYRVACQKWNDEWRKDAPLKRKPENVDRAYLMEISEFMWKYWPTYFNEDANCAVCQGRGNLRHGKYTAHEIRENEGLCSKRYKDHGISTTCEHCMFFADYYSSGEFGTLSKEYKTAVQRARGHDGRDDRNLFQPARTKSNHSSTASSSSSHMPAAKPAESLAESEQDFRMAVSTGRINFLEKNVKDLTDFVQYLTNRVEDQAREIENLKESQRRHQTWVYDHWHDHDHWNQWQSNNNEEEWSSTSEQRAWHGKYRY